MSDAGVVEIRHGGVEYVVLFDGRGSIHPPEIFPEPTVVTEAERQQVQPKPERPPLEDRVLAQLPATLADLHTLMGEGKPNLLQALLRLERKGQVVGTLGSNGHRCYVPTGATTGGLF